MLRKNSQTLIQVLLAMTLATLMGTACNSGTSTPNCTNCSAITPENFVSSLVQLAQSGQIASGYANSKVAKDSSLQPGYFVIWDGETQTYIAINIETTQDGGCTGGSGCTNSNPQAAALAFVNGPVVTHLGVSGGVSVANGTEVSATFGGYSYPDSDYANGYYQNNAGWLTGIPLIPSGQVDSAGNPIFNDTYGDSTLYSVSGQTKDVDLQRAQAQNTSLLIRAARVSSGLQMDFKSAIQLTQLADRIQMLQTTQKEITDADRDAITQNLLGIAGVSQEDLNQAIASGMNGDNTQVSALIDKVSKNMGMPGATFRNEILPKLGVNLN